MLRAVSRHTGQSAASANVSACLKNGPLFQALKGSETQTRKGSEHKQEKAVKHKQEKAVKHKQEKAVNTNKKRHR